MLLSVTPSPVFSQLNLSKLTQLHPKTPKLPSYPTHRAMGMTAPFKCPLESWAESRHSALWPEERGQTDATGPHSPQVCGLGTGAQLCGSPSRGRREEEPDGFRGGLGRGKSEQSPHAAAFLPGAQSWFPWKLDRILVMKKPTGQGSGFLSRDDSDQRPAGVKSWSPSLSSSPGELTPLCPQRASVSPSV